MGPYFLDIPEEILNNLGEQDNNGAKYENRQVPFKENTNDNIQESIKNV